MKKQIPIFTFLLFFAFTTSCDSSEPRPVDESPFGVFPLNDTKWVETEFHQYDRKEDNRIFWTSTLTTYTYFVRQIGENKAELYYFLQSKISRDVWLPTGEQIKLEDSIVAPSEPRLIGWILLEGKRVYFQTKENKQLMFDFNNMNVGEPVDWMWKDWNDRFQDNPNYIAAEWYVKSIDTVRVGNEYRRQYWLTTKQNAQYYRPEHCFLVEGIGCVSPYFFYTIRPPITADENKIFSAAYYKDRKIFGGLI